MDNMVVTWWIVAFLPSGSDHKYMAELCARHKMFKVKLHKTTKVTPTRLVGDECNPPQNIWRTALCLGCIILVSGLFRLGRCVSYIPVKRLSWCALIGHSLLYSLTIKCLNFTIFWITDEVSDETSVWLVTNFCVTYLITTSKQRKFNLSTNAVHHVLRWVTFVAHHSLVGVKVVPEAAYYLENPQSLASSLWHYGEVL